MPSLFNLQFDKQVFGGLRNVLLLHERVKNDQGVRLTVQGVTLRLPLLIR